MVWLHGGGFTLGAGGLPPYNGRALAKRGTVVVTIITVSATSAFCSSGAGGEEERVVHNFALLDQIQPGMGAR